MSRLVSWFLCALSISLLTGCFSSPPPPKAEKSEKTKHTPTNASARRHAAMRAPSDNFGGNKEALALIEQLNRGSTQSRIEVCVKLGNLQYDALEALPHLHTVATTTTDPNLKRAAADAKEKVIAAMRRKKWNDAEIENKMGAPL